MTKRDVLNVIRDWVNTIVNTEAGKNWKIIFSNQNSPRPTLPYFVIQDPMISNNIVGRGNWSNWNYTDESQDQGEVTYSITYEATIQLGVVGEDGDIFRLLDNSLNRQDIKSFFQVSNVSILRTESEIPEINITGDYIEKRAIKDIIVAWNDQGVYDPSYIKTIELEENYIKQE